MDQKGFARVLLIFAGVLLIPIIIFAISLGVGYVVGSNKQFQKNAQQYVDENKAQKKTKEDSVFNKLLQETKSVSQIDTIDEEYIRTKRIPEIEKDPSKKVIYIKNRVGMQYYNSFFVCKKDSPADLEASINELAQKDIDALAVISSESTKHPECYETRQDSGNIYLITTKPGCSQYKDLFQNQYNTSLGATTDIFMLKIKYCDHEPLTK